MGTVSEPGGTEMGELDGIVEVAAQAVGGVSGGGPGDRLCRWRRPDRSPESMVAAPTSWLRQWWWPGRLVALGTSSVPVTWSH
jgi:hypothetical protein